MARAEYHAIVRRMHLAGASVREIAQALDIPLGWPDLHWRHWDATKYADDARVPHDAAAAWVKLAGLIVTAFALTLGAPFWFDLLNKFINFRATGPPPKAAGTTT